MLAQLLALGLVAANLIQGPLQQGGAAALFGLMLRLPWWWLPLNALFPVAINSAIALALPAWLYLAAFLSLWLLQRNASQERVPLYLTNTQTWQQLDRLIAQRQPARFIDLGSGLGGTLFYLAERHPQCHFVGIESAPLPYLIARLRLRIKRLENVELRYGDFWRQSLADYEMVYAFLSPAPMPRLFNKVQDELHEGSLFISNTFTIPTPSTTTTIPVDDRRGTRLYYWQK